MGKLYGLVGRRLGHSFSQQFFTHKFANEDIEAQYQNFELDSIDQVRDMTAANPQLEGFNVTIPYKLEIIPLLDYIDPTAKKIGAVNCVKIVDGKLYGYNTDAYGFKQSLMHVLDDRRPHALVLGNGGAAQAVKYSLGELGIAFKVVSRKASDEAISYDQITEQLIDNHHLIINTTPLGMLPEVDSAPEIPYQYLTSEHTLYDLVYNPAQTKFMTLGKQHGATTANGSMMLIGQALGAWSIWCNDDIVDLNLFNEEYQLSHAPRSE